MTYYEFNLSATVLQSKRIYKFLLQGRVLRGSVYSGTSVWDLLTVTVGRVEGLAVFPCERGPSRTIRPERVYISCSASSGDQLPRGKDHNPFKLKEKIWVVKFT